MAFDLAGNSTGVDVFVFGGPTLREAVQRYNLFSGGGCVPPMWGLGQKYRTHSNAEQREVLELASSFRRRQVPCDMFGRSGRIPLGSDLDTYAKPAILPPNNRARNRADSSPMEEL